MTILDPNLKSFYVLETQVVIGQQAGEDIVDAVFSVLDDPSVEIAFVKEQAGAAWRLYLIDPVVSGLASLVEVELKESTKTTVKTVVELDVVRVSDGVSVGKVLREE